jgi:hypothetical protein
LGAFEHWAASSQVLAPASSSREHSMFTAKDYDQALLTPEKVFSLPMEVVDTESLTTEQKLKVLKQWETDAHGLEVAAEESMTGGERSRLGEVRRAIHELCEREGIDEKNWKNLQ